MQVFSWQVLKLVIFGPVLEKTRKRERISLDSFWGLLSSGLVFLNEPRSELGYLMFLDNTGFGMLQRSVNDFWREYGYHHGSTVLRNHPEVFAIESTNYCNLRCVMCPRGEPDIMERDLGNMSDELFQKILGEVKFYSNPCWFHWFGEPLMHPRLFEQIEYARTQGVRSLGISSNATLLTPERSQAILDSGLNTVMFAIDGTSKEVYEKIRISSTFTFEEVCSNVKEFLSRRKQLGRKKPHTILSIIVMEETKSQIEAFKDEWKRYGADEVIAKPYVNWANQDDQFVDLAVTESREELRQSARKFPCGYLWKSVVIAWDGRVLPCCYDYDATLPLGDLKSQTLQEVWNGEKYQQLRKNELGGCNTTALCRNCNQAPGTAINPLWPLPSPVTNLLKRFTSHP